MKVQDSLLRVGRTRVDLPYINGYDFRMTPNTFEAIGLRVAGIENVQLGFGHVFRIKTRTSTNFESMSDVAGVAGEDKGVSAISLRYNFSEGNYIALSEQYGWDMFNSIYFEGEKLIQISDCCRVGLGAQFTDQRSVGSELLGSFDTQSAAVKAAVQYGNLTTSVSYQWTANGSGVVKPWGGTPAYHSSIIQDFDRAGEESFRIGLTYDLEPHGLEGLSMDTSWVTADTPDSGKHASPDQQEFDFTVDYRPKIELFDGVWFRARYANNSIDGGAGLEDIRFILNYSYDF
ncbi:OprD family outer membrane porin [Rubritalea profundi]|uniref:OprD family outer membrane porin n=1 Tax=Rubritalea profundi TaxID=1658618 RepID=UPI000CF43F27|nr:OprD family outer membrane porin [Rubritalea profundi]